MRTDLHGFLLFLIGEIRLRRCFFIQKRGRKEYYQVCYLLPDETVAKREFGNLEKIPDQYPKYVISMDPMTSGERQGIEHLHIQEFLLK